MNEKVYVPEFNSIALRWTPSSSEPRCYEEAVGLAITRYPDGYAYRCYCSDGVLYEFPKDLEAFFNTVDERALFFSGTDHEIEAILKWLGPRACLDLLDGFSARVGKAEIQYHGYTVVRVAGGKAIKRFWNLKPFYPMTMIPEDSDCYGVQAMGERLLKTLMQLGLAHNLSSCGSLMASLGELSRNLCTSEVNQIAYNAYHGGWIEAMKLGSFDMGYDYDLSSAYPTEAAKLLDCSSTCGYWVKSRRVVSEAAYGFCYCTVSIDLSLPFSPIMCRTAARMSGSGRLPIRSTRNPVGDWSGWLTFDEIKFIVKNWLGRVEIEEGIWFIPTRYRRPFTALVGGLNTIRRQAESRGDKLGAHLGKTMAATIQGMFMQTYIDRGVRRAGNAFNPVYAATITSRVRLKVAEIAYENVDDILMVMVDGLLTSKPVAVPRAWRLAHQGECVVANHGDYDLPDRKLSTNLRQQLEENADRTSYPMRAARYTSLSEALEGDAFWAAGCARDEVRARVDRVGKRGWPKLPKRCQDLLTKQYDSYPLLPSMRSREIS